MFDGMHTLCNVRRDFCEWHLGRSPYVFWALDVDLPAVRTLVARAGAHLAGRLLDGYCREPHVTLDLCGFPAAVPALEDEFSSAFLERQLEALCAAQIAVFEIEVGVLDSFSSAPYLGVTDPSGGIPALRRCLALDGPARLFGDYVPHVTVGLYGGEWPADDLKAQLEAFPADERTPCRIERVSLMAYDPAEIGGRLGRIADYDLASGEMVWRQKLFG